MTDEEQLMYEAVKGLAKDDDFGDRDRHSEMELYEDFLGDGKAAHLAFLTHHLECAPVAALRPLA